MASIAWWWAIPIVALVIGATWAWWSCRSARAPSMHDSMADYEAWSAMFGRVRDADPLGYEDADPPGPETGAASPARETTEDRTPETRWEPPGESP
jgi:hypothetical protein